jgi:nucleoid DNA-binding protein
MLSNSIKNLLKIHGRIIVPDLGAFIYKGGPFPTIYFNEFLRYDDGILVDYLVETDKVDKNAASDKVKVFVDNISKQLSASKSVELEGLGTLFKDSNDKIQLKTGNMKVNNSETPVQVEKDEPREVYFEIEKTEVTQPPTDKKPVSEPIVQPKVEVAGTEKAPIANSASVTETPAPQTQVKTPVAKTTTEVQQQKQQQQQQANQPYRTPPPKKPIVSEMPRKKSSKGWVLILFLLIAGAGVYFGYYNPVWKKYFGKAPFISKDSISAPAKQATQPQETSPDAENKQESQAKPLPNPKAETKTPVTKQTSPVEVKKSTPTVGGKKFHLVAGSFSVEANADKMVQKMKSEGFNAEKFVTSKSNFFYVSYGAYDNRAEAAQEMDRIKATGKENIWILNY